MTPELWQRLKPLFDAAVEKPHAERDRWVTEACGEDRELRSQLAELLDAHERETIRLNPQVATPLGHFHSPGLPPDRVLMNRFRIVRRIGTGGMGEVYEAVDLELNQTIALKTIRGDLARNPEALSLFKTEVQLARRVSGPDVCRIHEFFVAPAHNSTPPVAFLTMELLNGVTLQDRLRQTGPLRNEEVKRIAVDICAGLAVIHQSGIIHRDLKPRNVMLVRRGGREHAVLMDFGVAHELAAAVPFGDRGMAGTPEYMAPEQFAGKAISPATDIYALGVVLYEMLTGIHPFTAPTPMGAAIRRASHPNPPSFLARKIPRHWDRVIAKCLEYEPQRRFQSSSAVAEALLTSALNPENLRRDHPTVFAVLCAAPLLALVWSAMLLWQNQHYYRPGPEALHWYQAGVAALREGTYVRAINSLQQALSSDSQFPMAHARMAEALADLDFEADAQRELLIALPQERRLSPLDRMYLKAIRAKVTNDNAQEIALYARILQKLPAANKSDGTLDLAMAYERSGDIDRALKLYEGAAAQNRSSPAPYMHIAVLQSRLLNAQQANPAFDTAESLFAAELNQEGLAELHYEKGYALNVFGRAAEAKALLRRALEEAAGFNSVPLQVRALAQLSSADYLISASDLSAEYQEANEMAERAERLARDYRLDSWLADGLVRRANVQLMKGQPKDAEVTVREAMRWANQTHQLRVQAMANLTLASVMNQEGYPDQVIAPAQAAREYYQKHGYLSLAEFASLLLVRTQRDQGHYQEALQAGNATLEMANRSGIRRLIMQSEEAVGSVYASVENYPEALPHYQRAAAFADKDDDKGKELLHSANALWQIGRYRESDAVLDALPAVAAVQWYGAIQRSSSLLSRRRYKEAQSVAAATARQYREIDDTRKQEFLWRGLLAQSHLGQAKRATPKLQQLASTLSAGDPSDLWERRLAIAEVNLTAGNFEEARRTASAAADYFMSLPQPESQLRSVLLGACAARALRDEVAYQAYSKRAIDILNKVKETWGPDSTQSYLTRPDIVALLSRSGISSPLANLRR